MPGSPVPKPISVDVIPPSPPLAPPPAPITATSPVPSVPKRPPTAVSKPAAPILAHVRRELEHKGSQEMPGNICGKYRALRDASREFSHRHGLLSIAD